LSAAQSHKETNNDNQLSRDLLRSGAMLQWGMSEGQRQNLKDYNYMSLTGLSNIIQVFDDIEKGKLRNLDFLECFSCWGGCVNGNLTVDNLYVARSKLQRLLAEIQEKAPPIGKEVREYLNLESLHPRGPIRPRPIRGDRGNMKERIKRIKDAEAVLASLPGLNCGLCGTPSCKALSKDIVFGDAKKTDCIFYSEDRLEKLRAIYLENNKP
jgi:hypothetical protein